MLLPPPPKTDAPNPANQIAQAFLDVPKNIGENIGEQAEKVGKAFEEGGIGPGLLETADAMTPGTVGAGVFEALGIIPDTKFSKSLTAAFINGMHSNPMVFKNLADAYAAYPATTTSMAPSHAPATPTQAYAAHHANLQAEAKYGSDAIAEQHGNVPANGGFSPSLEGTDGEEKKPVDIKEQIEQAQELTKALLKHVMGPEVEWGLSKIIEDSGIANDAESEVSKLPPGASFEDFIAAFMIDVVKDQQQHIKGVVKELRDNSKQKKQLREMKAILKPIQDGMQAGAQVSSLIGGLGGPVGAAVTSIGNKLQTGAVDQAMEAIDNKLEDAQDSRQILMEKIKNAMNKLQQMQQCLSNILNSMHQGAMNAIRNIK